MKATLARLSRLTTDPLTASDGPLLSAFLAGDQNAFALLVRRHAGLVFATCRRILRHQQDAEDAFQATFLVLARRAADVWPREAVGSWLFGVAHRVALKARAVRSRKSIHEKMLEDVASEKPQPPDFDLVEVVHRVVCKLPEVYRAAVVACDLEGLSRKEAAERLGWSEGTLSGRLARARELLATRLRRLGLSLPAGGMTAVFAAAEAVSATTLQSTIDLATGAAGSASAPVAALTEGIVRSMAIFKLKTMAAVVFAACAVGFGAFAATGNGADAGDGSAQQKQSQAQVAPPAPVAANAAEPPKPAPPVPAPPATSKRPRVELAQRELEIIVQDLAVSGKGKIDPALSKLLAARLSEIVRLLDPDGGDSDPDRDRLQGSWRVVALTEGGKTTLTNPKDSWVIEFTGGRMKMPFRELEGVWKMREYSFSVDGGKMPRTIDLAAPGKPLGRGIYEFTGSEKMCTSCHEHPFKSAVEKLPLEVWGLCAPALKNAKAMREANLRLALSIDGKQPAKFGGTGVIVFELRRPEVPDSAELAWRELMLLQHELESLDKGKIDPDVLERIKLRIRATEALLAVKQPPPKAPAGAPDIRVATAALQKAQAEVEQAKAEAAAGHTEVAKAQAFAAITQKKLQDALDRLKAAEKAFNEAGAKPQPKAQPTEETVFTIHLRTMTAAEKVIRVKATGKETVADGLVYAGNNILAKPNNFTVWVLRDGTVMPVDLVALSKNADAKTDYPLKSGDQLFVQVKPGK